MAESSQAAAPAAAPASDGPVMAEASGGDASETYSSIKKETIIAPFNDQFADIDPKDKVFWQFTVPKAWKEGEVVRVVLPSRLELSFMPPAGSKPNTPLAFLVPLAETLRRESGVEKKSSLVGGAIKLARRVSFGRKGSFSRRPKKDASSDSVGGASSSAPGSAPAAAPVFMEIDLFKKEQGVLLGLSLTNVGNGHPPCEGVLVARISQDGLVGRSKKMRPGDLLHAINGVKVTTHQQAVELLKQATGMVQCVVTRPEGLPEGWEVSRDKAGEVYYLHKAQARFSYSHPLAIDLDPRGVYVGKQDVENHEPKSPANSYRDGIEAMSTRAMMVEEEQDMTSGRHSRASQRDSGSQLETTSL